MKKIALYAGLVLLGSILGSGGVYAASGVLAKPSTFRVVLDGVPTLSGPSLYYQGKAYVQVSTVLNGLASSNVHANWRGTDLMFWPDVQNQDYTMSVNEASKFYNQEDSMLVTDITDVSTIPTSVESDANTQSQAIQSEIHHVADWRVQSQLDNDIKDTWLDALSNINTQFVLIEDIANANISNNTTASATVSKVSEEYSFALTRLMSHLNDDYKAEGWTSQ